jgi:hypothetical protein
MKSRCNPEVSGQAGTGRNFVKRVEMVEYKTAELKYVK